ncbi:MAG: ABC transporter permease, partial [Acidobacteriota bacterium]
MFTVLSFDLTAGTEPQAVAGAKVSSEFFRVLGIQPVLGRTFTSKEDMPGNDRVVVLSDAIWKERFNNDPAIIGRNLTINSTPYTVIGVLPAQVEYPENARIWTPIAFTEQEKSYRGSIYLDMIGRLKLGISLEAARQELKIIARRLETDYPQTNRGVSMTVMPLAEVLVGDVRLALLVLAGAVGFVLLIACANLANLLVANAASRTREFAVRSALGASRGRLLRQMLTESLLLSMTGGLFGALFAFWSLPAMRALSPAQLPRIQEITMDAQVLSFTLLISMITGVLFGLAPAFGFSRPDLQVSLKEGTRTAGGGPQSRRLGNALIVFEVGLVLVLLAGAGLMVRSFSKLTSVDPGFDPSGIVSFQLTLPDARYPERAHRLSFINDMIESLKRHPGTESV